MISDRLLTKTEKVFRRPERVHPYGEFFAIFPSTHDVPTSNEP